MKNTCCRLLAGLLLLSAAPLRGQTTSVIQAPASLAPPLTRSLLLETQSAIRRGADWLAGQQHPNGAWSNTNFPALTGLALWALLLNPAGTDPAAASNAVNFILSCARPDGGIYRELQGPRGGGLPNYNTALCAIALQVANRPDLQPALLKARRFLQNSQHRGQDIYAGGFGYDRDHQRAYADLNNSFYAYEAMRLTEPAEKHRPAGEPRADLDWEAAARFAARCQNYTPDQAAEYGGFYYRPDESKAGAATNQNGATVFKSHGSMTYAGLLVLRFAGSSQDDRRVREGIGWSQRHWNLDENTGAGQEALYSYYHLLAKALVVYGDDLVARGETLRISGRQALVEKLLSLQKTDHAGHGFWVNDNGRYWESDPVLATAYAMISLGVLLPEPAAR